MSAPSSGIVDLSNDRHIEVLEAGSGAPLLFLHSAGGIPQWDGVLPILSKHFHVYAPLLPGFGSSTGLDAIDDHFDLFFHCFDVVEALGLGRSTIVGHSWGGNVALVFATSYPELTRALVLVDGGMIEPSANPEMTLERALVDLAPPDLTMYTFEELLARVRLADTAKQGSHRSSICMSARWPRI